MKVVGREVAAAQLQQYGLYGLSDEQLDGFAVRLFQKKVFPHNLRHPYVKLKLKILSAYFSRIFGAKVLDFPHDFKSVIGIYAHFFDKHIGKCLC